MPDEPTCLEDPRIQDTIDLLRDLWPECLSAREEAAVRGTLAASLPRPGEPDLATAEGRRTLTRLVWTAADVTDGAPLRSSPVVAAAVRLALETDSCASGSDATGASARPGVPDDVTLHGASHAWMARRGTASAATGSAGGGHAVAFAFPWRPSPVGTRQRLGTATAHAGVTPVDPADAPVACSLWTPDGYLDVRRHCTTWLRPVLSPGSWKPIGLEGFAEAAATGVAWRDNPFLAHTGRGCPTFNLGDYASPRALAKGDDRRIAAARDACLARAGWLCVIDGIVHRTTDEPLAGVAVLLSKDGSEGGPVWSLGDLDSTCVMDTVTCFESVVGTWSSGRVRADPYARSVGRCCFVPAADWVGAVAKTPAQSPQPEGVISGRWPTAHGLVRLGDGTSEPSDVGAVLRAAAVSSADAMTTGQRRDAVRGYGCEFGDLHVLLGTLCEAGLESDLRRAALSYVEPTCRLVADELPFLQDPIRLIWAYVLALARHVVRCEAACDEQADDFATLRL